MVRLTSNHRHAVGKTQRMGLTVSGPETMREMHIKADLAAAW